MTAARDSRRRTADAPGRNVFVWQEVKMGVLQARSALHLLDEATARERIGACSLAISEPPPVPAAGPAKQPAAWPGAHSSWASPPAWACRR